MCFPLLVLRLSCCGSELKVVHAYIILLRIRIPTHCAFACVSDVGEVEKVDSKLEDGVLLVPSRPPRRMLTRCVLLPDFLVVC